MYDASPEITRPSKLAFYGNFLKRVSFFSSCRISPMRESQSKAASGCSDLSSDGSFSPPSAVPQALSFSPEKSDFTFSKSVTTEAALVEAQAPEDAPLSEVRRQAAHSR